MTPITDRLRVIGPDANGYYRVEIATNAWCWTKPQVDALVAALTRNKPPMEKQMTDRQPVFNALAQLNDVSFLLAMSAAAGVAKATAAAIVDDPTPENVFVDAVLVWESPLTGKPV